MAMVEVSFQGLKKFSDLAVARVLVQPGDTVGSEQALVLVESEAISLEIPSTHPGVVKDVRVKSGDAVADGAVIATIDSAADTAAAAKTPKATPAPPPASTAVTGASSTAAERPKVNAFVPAPHATPSMRRHARELGIPLDQAGTLGGAVAKDAGSSTPASSPASNPLNLLPWPKGDFAKFGPVDRRPRSRIQKISAANLHRNWVVIPHVTNHDEADITDLEAFRLQLNREHEKSGVKVTMLAFLIKATVAALKRYPGFNASLDGDELVLKRYFNVGFAADTPHGLMVPVIADADKKGIVELATEAGALAAKARDGKLSPSEMTGGCFSISSLGGIGGTSFTPIINAPEVAILGVCKSSMRPVWDGKGFVPRLMLPLSLSWDHRVVDGAAAARFLSHVGQTLADFRRVNL